MTIRFRCVECGKQLKVDDKYAGRRGTCSHCGAKTYIPTSTEAAPAFATAEGEVPAPPVSIAWNADKPKSDEDEYSPIPVRSMSHVDHEDLIDMTAMVDIVFFLLIFFLVTSFQSLTSSLPMPSPESRDAPQAATAEPEEGDSISVRIEKDDSIWVEELRIEGEVELAHKLRDLRETTAHPDKVEIVASGDASQGAAITVMDSARDAGIEKFSMSIDDEAAN